MKIFYSLILVVLVSSCSSGGKKAIDKLYYRFPEPVTSLTDAQYSFVVKRPSALGILGNRPMVAQNSEGGLIQMQHNFWLESPKVLLNNYLNKVFNFSIGQSEITHYLNVEILHLEKAQDKAILELKFTIKNKKERVVFSKTYFQQDKISANNIPQFVKSMGVLINTMIQQFIDDIK